MNRRQFLQAGLATIGSAQLAAFPSPSSAAGYPSGPVRVVIPFPAGGPTDVVGRLVAQSMSEILKQSLVVDNRGGASGTIGADMVAKAQPNGQTLLINVSAQVINPFLYPKLPHDPLKDFTPITNLASTPLQLLVAADSPIHNVNELIKYVKSRPTGCSFASASNGVPGHLAGELFKMTTGIAAVHAPYKGSAPALTDLIGGQVTFMFDSMPASLPLVKAGKLRSLAVTGMRRSKSLHDVPTLVESGFPEMTMTTWYGLWGPAKTPPEIVAVLQSAAARALANQDVRARLADLSADPLGESPERFAAFCTQEAERYAKIIKAAGIRLA
ncbi:Bug family tripartite tricarboxylate transporter substrate binding protein [Cupriavidus necator]|uniref:Bug family tripartite tricarboxylate transporter substrate binding protein n=1 Tax=Cupriavidus necator TaxID=106590 RepID=UPI00278BA7CF|nr:tripartite tricarboxylate transporter substrate binding protein [Cupriavidus necator]MDQ0141183.1 tripartite-type tricarboxylate transporter receptor subunit TctC [Cupriavidus necator]